MRVPGRWIGGKAFRELTGRIGLARCRDCTLVFANPRPSQERLYAFYACDEYVCHETNESASAGTTDFLLDKLEPFLPWSPRTLLDFGAGGGGFLLRAANRGWDVTGFEPGRRGLESCRRAGLRVTGN